MTHLIRSPEAFRCCGVRVDAITLEAAVERLHAFAEAGGGHAVHLCNAWTLALAQRDPVFATAVEHGDLNLPDGAPLAWIGRQAGCSQLRGPVRGTDLLLATAVSGRNRGLRHYLYGSTPEVVTALAERLVAHAPGIELAGVESPPFRTLTSDEEAELIERLRLSQPDVVWIGLGTPLQDLFVDRFRHHVDATLVAVGAAFEFIAGTKPQAPNWVQGRGLEWAFRLATEPRRLWRRYLIGNALFLSGLTAGVQVYRRSVDQTE